MNKLLLTACSVALALPCSAQPAGPGVEDPWKALAKYDANRNGEITEEEYPRGERGFTNLDHNGDGVITRADFESGANGNRRDMTELVAGVLVIGADAGGKGSVTKAEFVRHVEKLDADHDGVLSADEMAEAFRSGGRRLRQGAITRVTRGVDTDGDGNLQVVEINALFAKLDADGDDQIASGEMPPERRSRSGRTGRRERPAEVVPKAGEAAPDFELPLVHDMKKTVALSSYKGQKPVALIFGSYTSPALRASAGRLKEIYEAHREDVAFLVVYIREAHAIDSPKPMTFGLVEDPITDLERQSMARTCMTKLALEPVAAVIDRIDDKANHAYKAWPERLYLVGRDGKIAYGGARGPAGFKPDELAEAIEAELKKIKQQ